MANDRLRDALLGKGLTPAQLAESLAVDPKTVERWITKNRIPYTKHRHAIAALLQESERYLWPDALPPAKVASVSQSEVVSLYPRRNDVPREIWDRLLAGATDRIEILVYVGMFLTEDPDLIPTLQAKGEAGARIRLLFGDPASKEVVRRSADEGIGRNTISAKIRNALAVFRVLDGVPGVEICCHGTTLYNSIFRYDGEMIVNPHIFGALAPHAPAIHLRRLSAGELFDSYAESFERVWQLASPPKWP